jgi:hypothetical protein
VSPPPAVLHQAVAIEDGVDGADGRQVRAVDCRRSFSRIFGAPQPGYSRFGRTITASSCGGSRLAWR